MPILLNDYYKVRAFQTLVFKIPWQVEIYLQQDRCIVDARKSLGVLSLNLDNNVNLIMINCSEEDMSNYFSLFTSFEP